MVDLDTTDVFLFRKNVLHHSNSCLLAMEAIHGTLNVTYESNDDPVGVNISPAKVR